MKRGMKLLADAVGRSWSGRLGAVLVFFLMSTITVAVWWNEAAYRREAIRNHSSDICRQAARKLESSVEGTLSTATLFGHWLLRDGGQQRRQCFKELADLMVAQVPGVYSVRLLSPEGQSLLVAPSDAKSAWPGHEQKPWNQSKDLSLSELVSGHSTGRFFAELPLERDGVDHGVLVLEFDTSDLIDDGVGEPIRSEFAFEVWNENVSAYRFAPEGPLADHTYRSLGAIHEFSIRNRMWKFEVIPRRNITSKVSGIPSAPVLGLGLLLSLVLAAVVRLLGQRMELLRVARDRALGEVAERIRVEEALRASEQLYRGVFSSATDGLVLLDDHGNIVQANPAACQMHGWEPGHLDGLSIMTLVAPESRHIYEFFMDLEEEDGPFRVDAIHVREDGSPIEVEVRGTRFHMGNMLRVLAILTDVTERNRAVQRLGMLSRKALMAQEDERARVSRDLHDELGQLLTASRFELGWLQKTSDTMTKEAAMALDHAVEAVEKSADELRRICRGLRPPLLDDLGLEPAARFLAREFEERTELPVQIDLRVGEHVKLSKEVALCTYRVLQEALNNISRHAEAKHINMSLQSTEEELILSVVDDGKGFDVGDMAAVNGVGITGMKERASLVGGLIDIRSFPWRGTRVVLRIPLSGASQEGNS